jgi:hypothetical protein
LSITLFGRKIWLLPLAESPLIFVSMHMEFVTSVAKEGLIDCENIKLDTINNTNIDLAKILDNFYSLLGRLLLTVRLEL